MKPGPARPPIKNLKGLGKKASVVPGESLTSLVDKSMASKSDASVIGKDNFSKSATSVVKSKVSKAESVVSKGGSNIVTVSKESPKKVKESDRNTDKIDKTPKIGKNLDSKPVGKTLDKNMPKKAGPKTEISKDTKYSTVSIDKESFKKSDIPKISSNISSKDASSEIDSPKDSPLLPKKLVKGGPLPKKPLKDGPLPKKAPIDDSSPVKAPKLGTPLFGKAKGPMKGTKVMKPKLKAAKPVYISTDESSVDQDENEEQKIYCEPKHSKIIMKEAPEGTEEQIADKDHVILVYKTDDSLNRRKFQNLITVVKKIYTTKASQEIKESVFKNLLKQYLKENKV